MIDNLLALCSEWEQRADSSEKCAQYEDLLPGMDGVYAAESATMRRLARELRRRLTE
jgi:hypothetical protein